MKKHLWCGYLKVHHRYCEDICKEIDECGNYDDWAYQQAKAEADAKRKALEEENGVIRVGER